MMLELQAGPARTRSPVRMEAPPPLKKSSLQILLSITTALAANILLSASIEREKDMSAQRGTYKFALISHIRGFVVGGSTL